MRPLTEITPEQLAFLQQQERLMLETITSPVKAKQIEALLLLQNWDALTPAFEAIDKPNVRLRAAAHANRMAEIPGMVAGTKLGSIAAKALAQYQRVLTPMGERAAVALCIDIFRGSEILDTPYIEKALAETLIERLTPPKTSNPANMTRKVKSEARKLLRAYFGGRQGSLAGRPLLAKLSRISREADFVPTPPTRSAAGNVVFAAFDKRPG